MTKPLNPSMVFLAVAYISCLSSVPYWMPWRYFAPANGGNETDDCRKILSTAFERSDALFEEGTPSSAIK